MVDWSASIALTRSRSGFSDAEGVGEDRIASTWSCSESVRVAR